MSVFSNLSIMALRQLVNGACSFVGISEGGDKIVEVLTNRFTDHSQKLTTTLQKANEQAWKSLEIALGGQSLWDRMKGALATAEDQAFREQVRAFLSASPLTSASREHAQLFQQALKELRAARSKGLLTGANLTPTELASGFARFNDPQAILEAEWKVVESTARELSDTCPSLSRVLASKSASGQKPSILAVAVRYYFRRAVETDQELFQGLTFTKLEALQEAQEKGFTAITQAISQQGQRLEGLLGEMLGIVVEIDKTTKEIDKTTKDTNELVRSLGEQFQTVLEQLKLEKREVRRSDSLSIRSDGERQYVQRLIAQYRGLPEEKRNELPALLSDVGKLEVATGDLEAAQRDFQAVASLTEDPKTKAEAHHNAYQAALERQQWPEALSALQQAIALDPARFAPFPLDRFVPKRILGAGGFGVVFLCQPRHLNKPVVIKSLLLSELNRDIGDVFDEATALEEIDHPAIIKLRDCGYADAAETRPYIMMDYFEGENLESLITPQHLLSPADLLVVAISVAEALQAAHSRGIMHRDVKPANILVRREGEHWRVKLIDFGLAVRPETLTDGESTQRLRGQTTTGKSIAGTMHYAAPEQMGQLPGVAVGPHSDVYGFGRSCYYALLGTPEPDDVEREALPEPWRKFLGRCTGRKIENRLPDFAAVLAGLAEVRQQSSVRAVPTVKPTGTQAPAMTETTGGESGEGGQEKWSDWNVALGNVTNAALVAFYKKELAAGQENYLRKRYLRYRIAGKRRWFLAARRLSAYVWQHARFEGDMDLWRSGLSHPDQVKAVKDGKCLSFSLFTDQDFQFFRQAATQKLLAATWTGTASEDEQDDEVEVDGVDTTDPTPTKPEATPQPNKEGLKAKQICILELLSKAKGPLNKDSLRDLSSLDLSWVGYTDPEARKERDAQLGYPSLLALDYVKTYTRSLDGGDERVYEITDAGRKALAALQQDDANFSSDRQGATSHKVASAAKTFNSLLREAGISPSDVRLVRHKDSSAEKGRTPYDLWHQNRPQFEEYQSGQSIGRRKQLTAPYWAVFLGAPTDETVFVGLYSVKYRGLLEKDTPLPHKDEVAKAGSGDVCDLKLQDALSKYIGWLLIEWGSGALAWVQYADRQEKPIVERRAEATEG